MRRFLLGWILSSLAVWIVSQVVPGFAVSGGGAAMMAALAIGLANGTVGLFLKIVTFPISVLTFGLFLLVVNALMVMLAAALIPGFAVAGFGAAFVGGVVLCLVNLPLRWLAR